MKPFMPKLNQRRLYLRDMIRQGEPTENPFADEIQQEINQAVLEDIQETDPSATHESVFGDKK